MTEQPPESVEPAPEAEPEASVMPKWVPILIGAILVTIAGFAVFTGLRDRETDTLLDRVPPRRTRANAPAPPGEPSAGASLVLPGRSGENTPVANEPVKGTANTVIFGGREGVQQAARIWARRGVVFNVLPEDTMVYVNDLPIGQVRQFNSMDEVYDFAEPGSYNIKLVAPNGAEKTFVITAAENAAQEVARISLKF